MSNSLAIAATTLTLRSLLQNEIPRRDSNLSGLQVTTLPPDMARRNVAEVSAQLNIFLYQTAVNAAWRNQDLPNRNGRGEVGRPPLALNLHYLLTAYGSESDDEGVSHRVLGGAMSVLHDHPLLGRDEIRGVLANNDLADQFERVRVTPLTLPMDEMSKLWTALQTNYRVSAGYEVTVLLIDSQLASRSALPVLKRGDDDRGPVAIAGRGPTLDALRYPGVQAAARLGDEIVITGTAFDLATMRLRFTNTRGGKVLLRTPSAGAQPGEIRFRLPTLADDPAALTDWAPGRYTIAAVTGPDAEPRRASALPELDFALLPTIVLDPRDAPASEFDLAVTCTPRLVAGQDLRLLIGDQPFAPVPGTVDTPPPAAGAPSSAKFHIRDVPAGTYTARLRVDGVDSLPVVYAGVPALPAFDPDQQVTIP
jgi:hypothetical protein